MSLRAALRTALLTAHIVVTVAALGGDLALFALGTAGLRGVDPRAVYPAAHLLAAWLVAPLAIASLATGILLSVTTGWKPFVYGWVTIKGGVTVMMTGLLVFLLIPSLDRAAALATGDAAGTLTHGQQTLYAVVPAAGAVLLTLNVVLGVVKPRRHRRRPAPTPARYGLR
jgi:hypothetical protein